MSTERKPTSVAVAREHIARAGEGTDAFCAWILDEIESANETIDIVEGDLDVDRLCDPFGSPLLVTGNLKCSDAIVVDEKSPLLVLGDLHASDLAVWMSGFYLRGNLVVPGLVFLHSGNDYSAGVDGDATFGVLYEGGMFTGIAGRASGTIVRTHNDVRVGGVSVPKIERKTIREKFVREVWDDEDDSLDDNAVFEFLRGGRAVLR